MKIKSFSPALKLISCQKHCDLFTLEFTQRLITRTRRASPALSSIASAQEPLEPLVTRLELRLQRPALRI